MKKILIAIMMCALVLQAPVYAAEPVPEQELPDSNTVRLLRDLDAVPELRDGSLNLTRGAFAACAARLAGAKTASCTTPAFGDVGPEHAYFAELSAAKALGLIQGDARGNFAPNDNILFGDAVEILLRLLGYYDLAEEFGGLDNTAVRTGLTKNLPAADGEYVTMEQYLALMSNALSINVVSQSVRGEYEVRSHNTLLQAYLGLTRRTGQVTACAYTALDGVSELDDDSFVLDTQDGALQLRSGRAKEELFGLLGHRAEVYCREEDGRLTAVSILPVSGERVLSIAARDLDRDRTTRTAVAYYGGDSRGSLRTARVSKSAFVVYNRSAAPSYTDEDFRITDGRIKLIDTDGDGAYDVAVITQYDYTLVRSVNTDAEIIYDQYNLNPLNLYLDEVRITENGAPLELDQITKSDLIVSERDRQGRLTAARRVLDRRVGTVERTAEDCCVVEGETYRLSGYYTRLMKTGPAERPAEFIEIKAGDMVCLLLDEDKNRAASASLPEQQDMQYGFLIALARESGFSSTVHARMLTESGDVKYMDLKPRTVIDGTAVREGEVFDYFGRNLSCTASQDVMEVGRVVKFITGESGLITRLDTDCLNTETEGVRDSVQRAIPRREIIWSKEAGSLSGYARVDGTTRIFMASAKMSGDDRDYGVVLTTAMTSGKAYEVEVYDVARDGRAGAVSLFIDSNVTTFIDGWDPVYMIDEFFTSMDEENGTVEKIQVYSLNGAQELTLKEGVSTAGLGKGDLIRCGIDFSGKVDNIETVLSLRQSAGKPFMSHTAFTGSYWFYFGEVIHTEGNTAFVRLNEDGTDTRYFDFSRPLSGRCHYLYDGKTEKITVMDMADLIGTESAGGASWVLMYAWKGQVVDVFAYQNIK